MFRKPVVWNLGKNSKLKEERGVSFEQVYERLHRNAYRIVYNPSRNHPGQRMFIVSINGLRYAVPYSEYDSHVFLRTIYRRKP